jgi:hypothetical protein
MHLKLFLDNSLSYIFLRLFSKVIFRKNSLWHNCVGDLGEQIYSEI